MRTLLRAIPVLAAGLYLFTPSTAEARRGIVFIQTGNTIKDIGELPTDVKAEIENVTNPRLGYLHDRFGVFWLDLWTWNGQYVIYADEGLIAFEEGNPAVPPEVAAQLLGTSVDKLPVPFWYRFPPLFVIIVVGVTLVASVAIINKVRSQGETHAPTAGEEPPPE